VAVPLGAQTYQRRAAVTGNGGMEGGKCTAEVVVDGSAEVQINGDMATLQNVSGQPPQWRRFECTGVMPANPANFRFQGIDGRGRQQLVRAPGNGGAAVVRIEDNQGGPEAYTFDITWGGGNYSNRPGGSANYQPGYQPGYQPVAGRFTADQAVNVCRQEVRQQAGQRYGRNIVFENMRVDDNPGRRDWVLGNFYVHNSRGVTHQFACSVNFNNGRVRWVQIDPQGGRFVENYGSADRTFMGNGVQNCQREVDERMRRQGYGDVRFNGVNVDDRAGRNDWVVGSLRANRGRGMESYSFSCRVNLDNGNVRSVDLNRQ
jgi:hypothetical protein